MYSNLIEEIIRSHTDKNKFNTGFSFFKRNLVINDYSKVDGDNITFYATVIDENHRNNYTAIISINTLFSKEELYSRVWGLDSYGDYATVAVHINRLREEIEDNPSDSKHIITVWGVGYKFV